MKAPATVLTKLWLTSRGVIARDDADAIILGLVAANFRAFQAIPNDGCGLPIRLAVPNLQPGEKSAKVSAPTLG